MDRRQIVRKSLKPIKFPCPDFVQLPLIVLKGPDAGAHMMPRYYMPPHVLMSWLHKTFLLDFANTILGTENAISEFWAGVPSSDPRLVQLRRDHPDYKKYCVPLVIHGDDVHCTKNLTLDTLSVESLLFKRTIHKHDATVDCIFFMSGVFSDDGR